MSDFNQIEYQTVILAALLHDVGKFVQRSLGKIAEKHTTLGEKCFEDHFRERLSTLFDNNQLNVIESSIGNHHEYQKYITQADYISAGLDRIPLDNEEKGDPSEERLLSIFEEISLEDLNYKKSSEYAYALCSLSLEKEFLFPFRYDNKKNLTSNYIELWEGFVKDIEAIPTLSIRGYLNCLYALLQKYTWCIPSATYKDKPDISLFDHAKITASVAGCLYYYEKANQSDTKPFLLVGGDISGIQNFIYRITKSQGEGGIAKRLRGRSFYLGLLQEVSAKYIIEQAQLFQTNILFCGGGRFELLLPNTSEFSLLIEEIKQDLNNWLFEEHGGELGIIIETIEADDEDLRNYSQLLQNLEERLTFAKKKKFISHFQSESFWTEGVKSTETIKICKVCGINKIYDDRPCGLCELHKEIGKTLPHTAYLVYTTQVIKEIDAKSITFGKFGTVYLLEKNQPVTNSLFQSDKILDIQKINAVDDIRTGFRFIGNIVPVAKEAFFIDKDSEDEDKKVDKDDVLSFEIIADASIGDKRIGILKMDVDFLGLIFAIGLDNKSISRISALSRLLDMFFCGYLNRICDEIFKEWYKESRWEHKDKVEQIFYIVYSGGDDILVVGPWSEIPKLAKKISDEFKEYTCQNLDINISAGVFLCKPKYPISLGAKAAGKQLDISKEKGRKRITLFGDTVEWSSNDALGMDELLTFGEELYDYITTNESIKKLPRGFVHGLLRKHRQYNAGQDPNFIPAIIYQLVRNIKNDELKMDLKVKLITSTKQYFKHIKIPASYALLKSRREE